MFDNQEKNDYFDGPDIEETPPEPKKPAYKPDDPAYWDGDESEWEHLTPRNPLRPWLWGILAFTVAIGLFSAWLWWFSPYEDEATQYGYVEQVEKRGTLFKTFEGVMLPYRELMDTSRTYTRDFVFSVEGRDNYRALRRALRETRPVRVEYKVYHAPLPWRGDSRTVVTRVDSVDPSRILPPR